MKNKLLNSLKNKFLGIVEPSEDKTKSLVILIVGFSVLIFLFGFIKLNQNKEIPKNNEVKETINFLSLEEIVSKYQNYKYEVNILDNNINTKYSGEVKDNINTFKETKDNNIINYKLENNIIINSDTNEEVASNYLYDFFNLNNLYNYIIYLKPETIEKNNNKIYEYKSMYNDLEIEIIIKTTIDKIEEISYTYNSVSYNIRVVV